MKQKIATESSAWALVTGATKGIGLAFAEELAHSGWRLVLVARNEQALAHTAAQLRSLGAPEVVTIACDLSAEGSTCRLHSECSHRGINIDLLVSNAGTFAYCDLTAMEPERIDSMVRLHITATTHLCRLFASDMAHRGRGAIVCLSSYAAHMAWPGLSIYSATKAYIHNFARALAREMHEKGVKVLSVTPAGVATELYGLPEKWRRKGTRWGILTTPERVARGSLSALRKGKRSYTPGFLNRLLIPIVRHLPEKLISFLRRKTFAFQK